MIGQTSQAPRENRSTGPWLRLQADMNAKLQFERIDIEAYADRLVIRHADGQTEISLSKSEIVTFDIKDAVGGGYLIAERKEGAATIAGFTLPLVGAVREALPKLQDWLDAQVGTLKPEETRTQRQRQCARCGKPLRFGPFGKCLRCSNKMVMLKRLLQYCGPHRKALITSGILMGLTILIELIPPLGMKLIVDELNTPSKTSGLLIWLVMGLALVYILDSAMRVVRSYLGNVIGSRIVGDIRRDMFDALMNLSMKYFDRRQVSQYIGRVNNDTEALKEFLTEGIIQWISQMLLAGATFVMLLALSWQLTLLILVPLPFFLAGYLWIWPKARSLWYSQWQASMRLQNRIGEALQGIRVIKAFAQEQAEKARVGQANREYVQRTVSMSNMWLSVNPIFALATTLAGLGIWYVGGRQALVGTMSIGTLIAFSSYLTMFFGPVQWFGASLSWINRLIGSAERVFETMDAPIDVPDAPGALAISRPAGEIRFHGVRYGYEPAYPVLKDIDLTIRPGEMIGVVGHSGAGKSTLINMICRFYDPDAGCVTLDGRDLRDIRQASLRKHIGVVLQETFLFDGTIAQNIAYGMPEADTERIIEAARAANAHDFICRMPEGYDTMVGERGHRLSGGEKQRIAIARALLLDPRILILDEATASVDSETELQIRQALDRLVKGRTTIAIAHRLSTLRGADRLIVLDQGRIIEDGTHDELYASRGTYYKLVESQQQMSDKPLEAGVTR